jgi:hypothetical protein
MGRRAAFQDAGVPTSTPEPESMPDVILRHAHRRRRVPEGGRHADRSAPGFPGRAVALPGTGALPPSSYEPGFLRSRRVLAGFATARHEARLPWRARMVNSSSSRPLARTCALNSSS